MKLGLTFSAAVQTWMALGIKRAVFTLVMAVKSLSSNVIYTHMRAKGQRSDRSGGWIHM